MKSDGHLVSFHNQIFHRNLRGRPVNLLHEQLRLPPKPDTSVQLQSDHVFANVTNKLGRVSEHRGWVAICNVRCLKTVIWWGRPPSFSDKKKNCKVQQPTNEDEKRINNRTWAVVHVSLVFICCAVEPCSCHRHLTWPRHFHRKSVYANMYCQCWKLHLQSVWPWYCRSEGKMPSTLQ